MGVNCPLPVVWEMTLGQLRLYMDSIKHVLPLHNCFAGEQPKQDVKTGLREIGLA